MSPDLTVIVGDALGKLRELPSESVHCCVTSPPYWGLRDYGTAEWEGVDANCDHIGGRDNTKHSGDVGSRNAEGNAFRNSSQYVDQGEPFKNICRKCGANRIDSQLGLEKTPEEYVAKMVEVFREVRRVLRNDGTLWLNLGDSYYARSGGESNGKTARVGATKMGVQMRNCTGVDGLKPKDLCGIPWRVAFALQADGWWLRSDIIWAKPNPMPESVTDRPTKAHEYLFLLTKSPRYFYDAESISEQSIREGCLINYDGSQKNCMSGDSVNDRRTLIGQNGERSITVKSSRNKRSVWTVCTAPYPEAHFATYPPDLIKPCILAGTSAKGCCAKCGAPWERIVEKGDLQGPGFGNYNLPKAQESKDDPMVKGRSEGWWPNHRFESKTIGWQPTCECSRSFQIGKTIDIEYPCSTPETIPCTLLDPFAGSGTTGAVALELGRSAVLIELSSNYAQLIRERCAITPGLALS